MTTITLNEDTAQELEQVAEKKGTTLQAVAEQAIHQLLLEEKREAIRRESAAFRAMHDKLVSKYPGQYVAVFQGRLIDHDVDQLALYQRVAKRYPAQTILIKKVTSSAEEVYIYRSPRIVHNDAEP